MFRWLLRPLLVTWSMFVGGALIGGAYVGVAFVSGAFISVAVAEPAYAPPAPAVQGADDVRRKSAGCLSCHVETDSASMHDSPGVQLGCTDCHGGNADVFSGTTDRTSPVFTSALQSAHVLPTIPEEWPDGSANPKQSYTLLNREHPAYVRFINPSDLRVADDTCGACHREIVAAAKRSIMATGSMLFGAASYANGILPFKRYVLGEGYSREGDALVIRGPVEGDPDAAWRDDGILPVLLPLPRWETVPPGDVFRVFESGGRNKGNLFPETGLPNVHGDSQMIEFPGDPDLKLSNRGPGTGARISFPVLNIHKTRLNDPLMWFLGTNDNPGDYRTSGCGACHVVYANDRDERHSGPYAQFGHTGRSQTIDSMINPEESGHPIRHTFSRAVPTSQCMSCHMHQPNMFLNTYLGYTMWDYESDAPHMFPAEQRYPSAEEARAANNANPEGAVVRGLWSDQAFLREVSSLNPKLSNTQFADYHGHGWNFRAVFKKDRRGNLLDEAGNIVPHDDPDKFKKAVHMSSVHLDVGMHCVDCHFAQDNHGDGHLYGEVANAVEIDCVDCHGTARELPDLHTSGPAAPEGGRDLSLLRNVDGQRRFEWRGGALFQRSMLYPDKEWSVSLVKNTVTRGHDDYNARAARAKLMSRDTEGQGWGGDVADLAHDNANMECYACHQSWTTSCGGCHLPGEANWKSDINHYKGGTTRNYTTYNPQVVRDQIFMLGRRGSINGGRIAPLRSTSALVLSSMNADREIIYAQQPPVSSSGYSSQAINPHFAHTVRKVETRVCSDCHLARNGDNNAIMAQTLGFGTNYIDFLGYHVFAGGDRLLQAVQVTEWSEPQAVIGSYLHRYVYPDFFESHQSKEKELQKGYQVRGGTVGCLQHRGEYLYTASGSKGVRVYDIASIANKGVSQKIVQRSVATGERLNVPSSDARCLSLLTTQPVDPSRNQGTLMREINQERPSHDLYRFMVVVDAREGLILVDITTLSDGDALNNTLERALTWNPDDILRGAHYLTVAGHFAYVLTDDALVVVNLEDPLVPRLAGRLSMTRPVGIAKQFRYLFVTDQHGLHTIDVTKPADPHKVASLPLANAGRIFVARTWAYVAQGRAGLSVVDVTKPLDLRHSQQIKEGIDDARDVVVAATNASIFAYVADGEAGLKVIQLTSPASQPGYYGFSPEPKPEVIAHYPTRRALLSLSRGLERDRAVDESGHQVSVFSRVGSGPLTVQDMQGLYLDDAGNPWFVIDDLPPEETTGQR